MAHTQGKWTQDTWSDDLRIFISALEFTDLLGNSSLAEATAGAVTKNLASTVAGSFFHNLSEYLRRTGVYADANKDQQRFGTAASAPGPSVVRGTSGPLALGAGYPPTIGASMNTLALPTTGPAQKGMKLNYMDVIYRVLTVNASVGTSGIQKVVYGDNAAPAISDIVAVASNLTLTQRANPYVKTIAVSTPALLITYDTQITLRVNITAGDGGTADFYGVEVGLSYLLN